MFYITFHVILSQKHNENKIHLIKEIIDTFVSKVKAMSKVIRFKHKLTFNLKFK